MTADSPSLAATSSGTPAAATGATPAGNPREATRPRSKYLLLSAAVLVLDQLSKWWIEANLPPGDRLEVIPGVIDFIQVHNTGVAFGMFASQGDPNGTWALVAVGLLALVFITWYFYKAPRRDTILLSALALVIGGAIGNLMDRVLQGSVTDFIDFYVDDWHWHTFNVADSAISVGMVLMILSAFLSPGDESAGPSPPDAAQRAG